MRAQKFRGKVSKRPNARAIRQTYQQKKSQIADSGSEQARGRQQNSQDNSMFGSAVDLAKRIQAERVQLFKAIAIVELCRLAAASLLEIGEAESMVPVFETTCDLLNRSAERLEWISADLQAISRKGAA